MLLAEKSWVSQEVKEIAPFLELTQIVKTRWKMFFLGKGARWEDQSRIKNTLLDYMG